MWKALNQTDKISVGETIRYLSRTSGLPLKGEVYLVVKTEQHYFEITIKTDDRDGSEPLQRKVVRLMDVGYNVLLERWSELEPNPVSL